MLRKKFRGIAQILCIFIAVWLLFYVLGEGNPNLFLYDDNFSQWLPVINSTFDQFVHTGKINYWNYYLMGGINILETGIYSIVNPLMFLAYIIFRLFGFSNTITIYVYLIMSIAMVIYNAIFSRIGIAWKERLCLLVCLSGCTAYYSFGNWYYVFNNILIGALMTGFFLLYDENKKCSYFAAGAILAFSIYLGNVQFTIYWYMIFAIVCFGLFLQKNYHFAKVFIINIIVALTFSFPQIFMNYRALNNNFLDDESYYYMTNLELGNFIAHSIIPDGIFSKLFADGTYGYPLQGTYFVGIMPVAIIVTLYLIHKNKKINYMEKLCISYIAASIVCLFYTFGKKGLVAVFLRSFPVFNSFRVLCKPYFLFVQLALLPLVFLCMKTKKYHDLLALGACLAVVNIMCSNGYAGGGGTAISYISKSDDLDFDNYRIMTILEERAKADNPYYNEKLLLRNFPTFFGTYSVGAYNLSYTSEQYNLVNRLMNNETMWSEYAYQNVAFADNFVLDNESTEQLIKNSVRYIFTDSQNILNEFKKKGLLTNICDVDDGIWLFEVAGVEPLALVDNTEKANVTNLGNRLLLDTYNCSNNETSIKLSFSYNEKYKAYYIDSNGKKIFCPISPDPNGYAVIQTNEKAANKIYVSYSDVWSVLTIGAAVLSDLFLLVSLWCLFDLRKI